jgi:hypothetical protein
VVAVDLAWEGCEAREIEARLNREVAFHPMTRILWPKLSLRLFRTDFKTSDLYGASWRRLRCRSALLEWKVIMYVGRSKNVDSKTQLFYGKLQAPLANFGALLIHF